MTTATRHDSGVAAVAVHLPEVVVSAVTETTVPVAVIVIGTVTEGEIAPNETDPTDGTITAMREDGTAGVMIAEMIDETIAGIAIEITKGMIATGETTATAIEAGLIVATVVIESCLIHWKRLYESVLAKRQF